MSQFELEEVKRKVEKLLEWGFIRLNINPREAPVLFITKSDSNPRFCVY